jgi:predicted GNAT family acetyltransferase
VPDRDYVVCDNPAQRRYELLFGDELVGEILYRTKPGTVVLVHTEVEPAVEGSGLGSRLVAEALDDIRARGLSVVPLCPFVAAYIRRHPEYADLVLRDRAIPN